MQRSQPIKPIIFIAIIFSLLFPLSPAVSKAMAAKCCDMNCGKNVMVCPIQKKSEACYINSVQCCENNCLKTSKSEIFISKRPSSQMLSQTSLRHIVFSCFSIQLDQEPSFFSQSFDTLKNKDQNHPLFLIHSVYLI